MKITQFTALTYLLSVGFAPASSHDHGHAHGPNGEHAEPAAADDDHGHAHGPNGEHAEPAAAGDAHGHAHGSNGEHAEPAGDDHGHDHGVENELLTVTPHAQDIIALKTQQAPAAQRNLVTSLHGFLDTPSHAYESYVLLSAGILNLKVRSAQLVNKGDLLFTVEAPGIAELVAQQNDAEATHKRLLSDIATMQTRLDALKETGTRNSELEEQLRFKQAEAAEQLLAGQNIRARLHTSAMGAEIIHDGHHVLLGIRAKQDGRISEIALRQGSWAQQGDNVLSMIDPRTLEIRASLYGNEQPQFSEAIATIPMGKKQLRVKGTLRIADQIDPIKQTRQLYFVADSLPAHARAGLLCRIDLYQHDAAQKGISIPNTAIIKVGVDDIVFVKRSETEYEAIKVGVLGTRRDMSTVTGIHAGEHIVVTGGYELKFLLGGNTVKQKQTGHFHADGKFHEGEDH